jgi:ABC-2 type transport system ATP-binding protein
MWEIIRQLVAGGVTIFLTTQYLEEADELAGRIGVLDHGRMVAEGTAAELKRQIPGGRIDLQFGDAAARDSAARLLGAGSRDEAGLVLQVPYDGRAWSLKGLLDRLETLAISEPAVSVHTPDLDDVFFALTGRPPTDQPRTEQPGSQQPSTEQDASR